MRTEQASNEEAPSVERCCYLVFQVATNTEEKTKQKLQELIEEIGDILNQDCSYVYYWHYRKGLVQPYAPKPKGDCGASEIVRKLDEA